MPTNARQRLFAKTKSLQIYLLFECDIIIITPTFQQKDYSKENTTKQQYEEFHSRAWRRQKYLTNNQIHGIVNYMLQ